MVSLSMNMSGMTRASTCHLRLGHALVEANVIDHMDFVSVDKSCVRSCKNFGHLGSIFCKGIHPCKFCLCRTWVLLFEER